MALTLIVSCGYKREVVDMYQGPQGPAGLNAVCTVQNEEEGVRLTCSDGSDALLPYATQGNSGTSCSVEQTENGATITCGESVAYLTNGLDGSSGSISVATYSANNCTAIAGSALYVKKTGSNNYGIYTGSTCASNTKSFEVAQGEAHQLANKVIGLWATNGLVVYNLN